MAQFNDASVSSLAGLLTTDLVSWFAHYPLYRHATSKVYVDTPQGRLPVIIVELDEHGDILITSEDA